jgi:hypothetical protein
VLRSHHHFYATTAPAPGGNFDAAPASADPASAPASPPNLLYSKPKFLKGIKVNIRSEFFFF